MKPLGHFRSIYHWKISSGISTSEISDLAEDVAVFVQTAIERDKELHGEVTYKAVEIQLPWLPNLEEQNSIEKTAKKAGANRRRKAAKHPYADTKDPKNQAFFKLYRDLPNNELADKISVVSGVPTNTKMVQNTRANMRKRGVDV